MVDVHAKITKLRAALLARITKADHYEFFQQEVNPDVVPDYRKYIKKPMAYSTIRERLKAGEFYGDSEDAATLSRFGAAMVLVCENAMACASMSPPSPFHSASSSTNARTACSASTHMRAFASQDNDDESPYYREAKRLKKETESGLRTLSKRAAALRTAHSAHLAQTAAPATSDAPRTIAPVRKKRAKRERGPRPNRVRPRRSGGNGSSSSHSSSAKHSRPLASLKSELEALRAAAASSNEAAKKAVAGVAGVMVQAQATILSRSIASLQTVLRRIEKCDHYAFFADPVDTTLALDYLTVVREPMDFSTMRKRLLVGEYSPAPHGRGIEALERDVELIASNCMAYNPPESEFYKQAANLRPHSARVIAAYRERVLRVSGGNPSTLPSHAARAVAAAEALTAKAEEDAAAVRDAERRLANMEALELASGDRKAAAAAAAAEAAAAAMAAAAREAAEIHELAKWWVGLDREYFCCSESQRRVLVKLGAGAPATCEALLAVPPIGASYELRWALEDRSAKHRAALHSALATPLFDGYDTTRFLEMHQDHTEGASLDVAVLSSLSKLGGVEGDHPLSRATFRFANVDDAEMLARVNTVNRMLYSASDDFEERLRAKNDFFIVVEEELPGGKGRQITAFVNYYFMWLQVRTTYTGCIVQAHPFSSAPRRAYTLTHLPSHPHVLDPPSSARAHALSLLSLSRSLSQPKPTEPSACALNVSSAAACFDDTSRDRRAVTQKVVYVATIQAVRPKSHPGLVVGGSRSKNGLTRYASPRAGTVLLALTFAHAQSEGMSFAFLDATDGEFRYQLLCVFRRSFRASAASQPCR